MKRNIRKNYCKCDASNWINIRASRRIGTFLRVWSEVWTSNEHATSVTKYLEKIVQVWCIELDQRLCVKKNLTGSESLISSLNEYKTRHQWNEIFGKMRASVMHQIRSTSVCQEESKRFLGCDKKVEPVTNKPSVERNIRKRLCKVMLPYSINICASRRTKPVFKVW